MAFGGKFSVEAIFKAVDQSTAVVKKIANNIGSMATKATRGLNGANVMADKLVGGFKKVARYGAVALGVIGAAMWSVTSAGAEFEQRIVNAAAKFQIEAKRGVSAFEEIRAAARRAGATTEFTAAQSADALNNLAMAGFDAKTAIASLPVVMNLATVAETDLAEATRIATKTMGAFGLMTKDATENARRLEMVSDLLAKTSVSANTTMQEMFDALRMGAPVTRAAGISMEDTAVMIAALANAGIDATNAGTALRQMSLALSAPTSQAAKVFRNLRIETTEMVDGVRKVRNIFDIFEDLKARLRELDPGNRTPILNAIFGKRGIAAGINLMRQSGNEVEDLRKVLGNYEGTVSKMASIQRNTLATRLKVLKSAFEDLKLEIFDATEGPINDLVISLTDWLRANKSIIASGINEYVEKFVNNWPTIKKLAIAIAAVTAAVGALIVILKILIGVMTVVNLVIAMNPIGLIATAIAILIIAIVAATVAVIFFREEVIALWDGLSGLQKTLLAIASPLAFLAVIASQIVEYWEPLNDVFADAIDNLKEMLELAKKFVKVQASFGLVGVDSLARDIMEITQGMAIPEGRFNEYGEQPSEPAPNTMVSPQERLGNYIKSTVMSSEVTIKDETGRAEMTGPDVPGLKLEQSGAF